MVKIIQLIGSLSDGGAETLVKDYALMIDRARFDLKIVAMQNNKNTANSRILADSGIKVYELFPRWNIVRRVIRRLAPQRYTAFKLLRIIEREQPDAMHVHLELLKYVYPIREKLKRVRLFYTCHSLPERFFEGKNADEQKYAEALIRENGMRMIAINPLAREQLNRRFSVSNTVFLRNAIDMDRFGKAEVDREAYRDALGIPKDAFVIGNIGRFVPSKNHDFLIDVFKTAKQRNANAFLLMIGTGPEEAAIKAKVEAYGLKESVVFLSARSDIPQLLGIMDAFVFSSKYEGLGIVAIEAQASGLHCVISEGVPEEAFISPRAIPMSLSQSPEAWAKAALDTDLRSETADRTHEYDMRNEIKRLERLYLGEENV